MAHYCLGYLNQTKHFPLVLGGDENINLTIYTDASLGTGPHARSVTGQIIKLNKDAGAISVKSQAYCCVIIIRSRIGWIYESY